MQILIKFLIRQIDRRKIITRVMLFLPNKGRPLPFYAAHNMDTKEQRRMEGASAVDLYIPGPSPNSFVPSLRIHKFCAPLYDCEWIKMGDIFNGLLPREREGGREGGKKLLLYVCKEYILSIVCQRGFGRRLWQLCAELLIYWMTFKLKTFNCALLDPMNPLLLVCRLADWLTGCLAAG